MIHRLFCAQCCLPALRLQCYRGYMDYTGYEGYVGYMGCEEMERRSEINLCHYKLIWRAGEHRATRHVYHISSYWIKEGYRSGLSHFILLDKRGLQVMFITFHPTACPVPIFSVWDWLIVVSTARVHTHTTHTAFLMQAEKGHYKTFTET